MTRLAPLALFGLIAVLATAAAADIANLLDEKAPEPSCETWWNGKAPRLSKMKGQVVVLHFHDPTRMTSKAFEGKLKELAQSRPEQPISVIEIVVDCEEVDAQSYVARAEAEWLVGWDGKGDTAAAYAGSSVPRTYLIGPDGTVAWHAHIGALTDEIVDAQLARARLFDEKALSRKARPAAKAARELRFGKAADEARKLRDDSRATDEDREIATTILADITRYHALQSKVVAELEKDLDWGVALQRVERMREIYRGTEHEDAVEAKWNELDANPRVKYVAEAERMLGLIIEKTDVRKKRDLESALNELKLFAGDYENTKPAERAQTWIADFERRLDALEKR